MTADHDVDIRDLRNCRQVARIADMGQGDDLVDALLLQFLDCAGDRRDILADEDVGAG